MDAQSKYCSEFIWHQFEDVRESPLEGAFEGTFACEVQATKSIKQISKNSPKSSKIHDYTRRAYVLRDVK